MLQKQIEAERAQGKVILSSTQPPGGYFLPETKQEIRRFIKTLENRGNKTLDALKGARALLDSFDEVKMVNESIKLAERGRNSDL